jgi:anionic cell wall polymer biosynthesis LytR-Cps2A-Psr (LCP) family protein
LASGANFRAGLQTLEGPAALAFVRQRHGLPRGDLDRVVRQQAFLASFAHEVSSSHKKLKTTGMGSLLSSRSRVASRFSSTNPDTRSRP